MEGWSGYVTSQTAIIKQPAQAVCVSHMAAHFAVFLPIRCSTDTCLLIMQLAIDNTLAPYLGSQFGFSTNKAANLASIFGMMNFWARPLGGFLSDIVGRR